MYSLLFTTGFYSAKIIINIADKVQLLLTGHVVFTVWISKLIVDNNIDVV